MKNQINKRETLMNFQKIAEIHKNYKERPVISDIHPSDVMHNTGAPFYFTVGESAISAILSGLSMTWLSHVSRVLDLPCGHGRVGRQLRAAFPDAEIHYCEIDKEGADFCASKFNGKAIHSVAELTDVKLPKDIDVIWVGSLFTHTDLATTTRWLNYLADHLSEHGILVVTLHGLFTADMAKTYPHIAAGADWKKVMKEFKAVGYGFATYPNSTGIDGYGVSLSQPSKIMDIATSIPGTRVLAYTERGWANNHDVLILGKHDRLKPF
jgi:Methyltransferase domain